jgi:hypothetical protein
LTPVPMLAGLNSIVALTNAMVFTPRVKQSTLVHGAPEKRVPQRKTPATMMMTGAI